MTTSSAPGKIILFGEHAVVYNRPALAVPVTQVCATVNVSSHSRSGIRISAPQIQLHSTLTALPTQHSLRMTLEVILKNLNISLSTPLQIQITSSIPVASGLGSGASVSVALIRALSAYTGTSLNDDKVNQLCYETEKIHHGTPSGIDNTVITYARPVFFQRGQPIETFQVQHPFTIVIADTGIYAPTRESVGDVRKLWQSNPSHWESVFNEVGQIVQRARQSIEAGHWQELGTLMDMNQRLLQEMTVSSAELDHLVVCAKNAGALGAKLSGGGRGGNMIALVHPENADEISAALLSNGARHTIITAIK